MIYFIYIESSYAVPRQCDLHDRPTVRYKTTPGGIQVHIPASKSFVNTAHNTRVLTSMLIILQDYEYLYTRSNLLINQHRIGVKGRRPSLQLL